MLKRTSDWYPALAEAIRELDGPRFAPALAHALRQVAPFDYNVIFGYRGEDRPIDLHDDFGPGKRGIFVTDYQAGPYLLDPFFHASGNNVAPGLYRMRDLAPDRFYQSEYYRSYYVQTGLTEEIGFWEVGLAPVTTQDHRDYALTDESKDAMLQQFEELAYEWLECALRDEHHGFSNVKDTLEEIHKGVSKAYGCGAGLGLMGVATDGNVALCHRFAGSEEHTIGSVDGGIDREKQARFLVDLVKRTAHRVLAHRLLHP